MASVVNSTTLQLLRSVNTPDYTTPWVVVTETEADTIEAISQIYRKWVTDHVEEMTQPEKDVVDAAILESSRDASVQEQIDNLEAVIRAFMKAVRDQLNNHAAKHNEITAAVDGAANFGEFVTNMQAITDYSNITFDGLKTYIRNSLGS